MNTFKFTINGSIYQVEIGKIEDNIANIEVNGTPYEVEVHREVKKSKTPTLVRKVVSEPQVEIARKDKGASSPVRSPLPGTIVEIVVRPGDIVKKDQRLLVMEAMKMENNILAEKDGVVEAIRVKAGDVVLQGDVLLEVL